MSFKAFHGLQKLVMQKAVFLKAGGSKVDCNLLLFQLRGGLTGPYETGDDL